MTITRIHHDAREGTALVIDETPGPKDGPAVFRVRKDSGRLVLGYTTMEHQWEVLLTAKEVQTVLEIVRD